MLTISGCASLSASRSETQQRELTNAEKAFINTNYELLYRIKELPAPIASLLRQKAPGIVNPREPFNSSDVMDPSLSSTQLSWAGISTNTIFTLYKQGGFAPHQRFLIIELERGQITASAEFIIPYYIDDMATLKQFVQSGKATIFTRRNREQYQGNQGDGESALFDFQFSWLPPRLIAVVVRRYINDGHCL